MTKRSGAGRLKILGAMWAAAAIVPSPALAQQGIEGRTANRDSTLAPQPAVPVPTPFNLPPADSLSAPQPGLASSDSFVVRRFDIRDATVFSAEELDRIVAPYTSRPITTMDLLALRDRITEAYIGRGYINSGAVIPDQDASDGTIEIVIIEGVLKDVVVTGLDRLDEDYVRARLTPPPGPLNRQSLQSRFERLLGDPNIAKLDARLTPHEAAGARPGEAALQVTVRENEWWTGEAEIASDRSPSVGGERLVLRSLLRNALGRGDRTQVELGVTEGLRDAAVAFAIPVTSNDVMLSLEANISTAEVVEEPLNALDIISDSYSVRGSIDAPVWRRTGQRVNVGAGLTYQRSVTELGGQRFSFSPGAVDGTTEMTVLSLTQDVVLQSAKQAAAFRSRFNYGLDTIQPQTPVPFQPPKNFLTWTGQVQYIRAMTTSGQQFIGRLEAQLTEDKLFSVQQYAFGGVDSVRGYRRNEVLSDNGAVGSVEYRAPLRDLAFWRKATPVGQPRVYGSVFVDGGYGWNAEGAEPTMQSLASSGVTLSWRPVDRVTASLYAAARLRKSPERDDKSLQDYGLGLRLTAKLW